jgi:hypothetical protein
MATHTTAEVQRLVERLDGDPEALRRVRDAVIREIQLGEGIQRVAQELRESRGGAAERQAIRSPRPAPRVNRVDYHCEVTGGWGRTG